MRRDAPAASHGGRHGGHEEGGDRRGGTRGGGRHGRRCRGKHQTSTVGWGAAGKREQWRLTSMRSYSARRRWSTATVAPNAVAGVRGGEDEKGGYGTRSHRRSTAATGLAQPLLVPSRGRRGADPFWLYSPVVRQLG